MLDKYRGPANDTELLDSLLGDTVSGVFQDGPKLFLVFSGGAALVLTSLGGESGPVFWREPRHGVLQTLRRLYRNASQVVHAQTRLSELGKTLSDLGERKPEEV